MTYEVHLGQDKGIYSCLAAERPDKVDVINCRTKKEARHKVLDMLYESPAKYINACAFDSKNNMLVWIERCGR